MVISSQTSSDALFSFVQSELEKKNTKTVPSTSNTLLSHLIGILLPRMKVEYIGTVFKVASKPFRLQLMAASRFVRPNPQRLRSNMETWSG